VTAIRSWQEQFDVRTAASRLTRTVWQSVSLRLSVSGDVRYGEDFRLGRHSTVWSAHGLVIGRSVAVGRSCTVEVDGVIGDYTTVSAHVGIIGRRDHETGRVGTPIRRSSWTGDRPGTAEDRVVIGRDVFIGWGSVVLSGVAIGDAAVVGASSVVTRDVADGSVVAGNPARPIGERFDTRACPRALALHLAALDRARRQADDRFSMSRRARG